MNAVFRFVCVGAILLLAMGCSPRTEERVAQRARPTATAEQAPTTQDAPDVEADLSDTSLDGRSLAESVRSMARMWDDSNRQRFEANPDGFVRIAAEVEQFGIGFVDDVRIFWAPLDDESLLGGTLDDTGAVKTLVTLTGLGGPANDAVAATSLGLLLGDSRSFDEGRRLAQDLVSVSENQRRSFLAGDAVVVVERRSTDGFISVVAARGVSQTSVEQRSRAVISALLEVASN